MSRKMKPAPGTTEIEKDPRWARLLARDRTADGQFWYTVATTGIYCRPSCPSRGCRPENVAFHTTLEAAKATGFRACRRCNPDGVSQDTENAILVEKTCRLLEQSEKTPSLAALADAVELSQSYFHRLFKNTTGLTPKAYAQARRAERVRTELAKGHSVTEAMYDAGFNSSGRFYEKSKDILGMTPTQLSRRWYQRGDSLRHRSILSWGDPRRLELERRRCHSDRGRSEQTGMRSPGSLPESETHRWRSRL
jgi:AraC family transcriptional regulator of adaptative response/methylated-DNA-[protein]-cysteine methyltransferase